MDMTTEIALHVMGLFCGVKEDWQIYQTSKWVYHLLTLITAEDVKNLFLIACFYFLLNI